MSVVTVSGLSLPVGIISYMIAAYFGYKAVTSKRRDWVFKGDVIMTLFNVFMGLYVDLM